MINWDPVSAEKGGYDRFMQKEIYEQPRAITDTIGTRVIWHEGSCRPRPRRHRLLARQGEGDRPRASRRVRHRVLRVAGRAHHDRAAREGSGRGRRRERVPLSQADRRRQGARDRRLPVRRDGRHARRAAGGQGAGRPHALGLQRARGHHRARLRRRPLHPRRSRDRRGLDQGVHDAGRRALPRSR